MIPEEILKTLINQSQVRTGSHTDERILADAVDRMEKLILQSSSRTTRNLWRPIMKSPLTKLAIAAVVIIACLIGLSLWRTTGSSIALADVLAQIEKVKAFRCKSIYKLTGEDPNKPLIETRSTSLWSKEYGRKATWEQTDPKSGERTVEESYILPAKKTFIRIAPKQKKYWRTEFDDRWAEQWKDDPRTMTKLMMEYKYDRLGRSTVDGIEVEGFRTTDPNYGLPGGFGAFKIQADQKMWVDVKTQLPVQYDFRYVFFDQMGNKKQSGQLVMQDFQWVVPVDAAEFEPVIPDDYTVKVIKYPPHITEETAIQGLKQCLELLGKYP